jgi:hypothetical protein
MIIACLMSLNRLFFPHRRVKQTRGTMRAMQRARQAQRGPSFIRITRQKQQKQHFARAENIAE